MSVKHFCSVFFITAAIVAAVSCKKDDKTESKPSLSGSLRFKGLPEYISAEKKFEVVPNGVYHPENKPIGYYWKQSPSTDNKTIKNDTVSTDNGSTILAFKDSLYTCTVTCGAFADGYYDSSISTYTTIVKPGVNGSVTNAGFLEKYTTTDGKPTFFPDADEVTEYYTEIGGYRWMRRNLSSADAKDVNAGIPFKNCEAMDDVFGRYYTYDEATGACPEGWELPKDDAWAALAKAVDPSLQPEAYSEIKGIAGAIMANALFNADINRTDEENASDKNYIMWEYEPKVKITNSTGLSVLPVGYAENGSSFKASFRDSSNKSYAAFVTGDPADGNKAYYRYIIEGDTTLHIGSYDRNSFAASVRCVQKIQ